jgi:oligopeptide/dipeptide ABC transporter ATP-binding protein
VSEILRLEALTVHFPLRGAFLNHLRGRPAEAVRAVDGIDLTIGSREIVALVGESGSGKTTTGRAIVQLERPTSGRILIHGQDMTRIRGRGAARSFRRRVQMIFQDPYQALSPRQTVFDAVAEAVRSLHLAHGRAAVEARVAEALAAAGLNPPGDYFRRFPHELSGGQRQRVVIAGALVVKPELIVADEPVSMLDVSIRAQILEILLNLRAGGDLAFLFITHDLAVAWLIADRIAVMYLGRIMEIGPAQEVIDRPRHPYTLALLEAAPRIHPLEGPKPPHLSGETPNAARIPRGCRFHPRCRFAFDRCRTEEPPLAEVAPGRFAACWIAEQVPERPHPSAPVSDGFRLDQAAHAVSPDAYLKKSMRLTEEPKQ